MANSARLPNLIQPDSITLQDQSIVDYQSETEKDASDYQEIWTSTMDNGPYKNTSMYRKVEVLMLCWAEDCDDWVHSQQEVQALKSVFENDFYYHVEIKFLYNNIATRLQLQVNQIAANFANEHDGPNTLFIVYYTGHGKPGGSYGSLLMHGKNSENDMRKGQDTLIWNKCENLLRDAEADVLEIFDCCYAGTLSLTKGNYRLFEYIAATQAMETTPRPGERSFTAALIYALKYLLDEKKGRRFTTTELMVRIVKAPNFPKDQAPQLSDRLENSPGGRIMLHPLPRRDSNPQAASCEAPPIDSSRQTIVTLHFDFGEKPTKEQVRKLGGELNGTFERESLGVNRVRWGGMRKSAVDVFSASLKRIRRRSFHRHRTPVSPSRARPEERRTHTALDRMTPCSLGLVSPPVPGSTLPSSQEQSEDENRHPHHKRLRLSLQYD